ncbi:hypothetical protein GCM10007063_26630 [Lentibacillus kapialis]|uniref:Uncharacterized protein n=1 Tax=Lentibacillus kapialis TaxID=340214 RepID=A0A917UZZ0_9BACI|nr:hypothetical protein GCM10007063_26630 [Lentibacillus kapialis]
MFITLHFHFNSFQFNHFKHNPVTFSSIDANYVKNKKNEMATDNPLPVKEG